MKIRLPDDFFDPNLTTEEGDLPPPPRVASLLREASPPLPHPAITRRERERSDVHGEPAHAMRAADGDPMGTLTRFVRRKGMPDPAAHLALPLGPIVATVAVAVLLAAVAPLLFGGLSRSPSPMAHGEERLAMTETGIPASFALPSPLGVPRPTDGGMLPAMDDASLAPFNGQLIHLDAQRYTDMERWSGATGALCHVRLADGREPWVPCWRLGKPDATPMPWVSPSPVAVFVPAPTSTSLPPTVCAVVMGIARCGYDLDALEQDARAAYQATVQGNAGVEVVTASPMPTFPPQATPVPAQIVR